ncbi:hypothetical protein [Spirochaeta thermophila]|uniref:Uncharacterized protein n=1 Tax=Winmispira thermophila (strain ATCC 49972 / DSM 6192 / RI 19.B1) TaxID=665571 RepID=E0RNY1_WINT6|nr:hypothetical protein [Spirochaeta thermophila]ADN01254.1 hypothetical protein STHERM_c02810 [Spirochaeta thermophila DSM 6192]
MDVSLVYRRPDASTRTLSVPLWLRMSAGAALAVLGAMLLLFPPPTWISGPLGLLLLFTLGYRETWRFNGHTGTVHHLHGWGPLLWRRLAFRFSEIESIEVELSPYPSSLSDRHRIPPRRYGRLVLTRSGGERHILDVRSSRDHGLLFQWAEDLARLCGLPGAGSSSASSP